MRLAAPLLLLCCLLLASCGWQLRGKQANFEELGVVFLSGEGFSETVVVKSVRAELHNSGVQFTSDPNKADYVVWIGAEATQLRTASYDVLVRAAENILILEATYELRNAKGELLRGPERVYAERLYEFDVQGVVSSAAQLGVITRELQDRLAQQIVGRLASTDLQGDPLPEPVDALH